MSATSTSRISPAHRPRQFAGRPAGLGVVRPLLVSEGSSALAPHAGPDRSIELEAGAYAGSAQGRPALRLVGGTAGSPETLRPEPARLRVTRAGRLTITLTVAFLVGLAVLTATSSLAAGSSPAVARTVVVRAGQTLSGIAAVELPDLPVIQGVARIQVANDLSTTDIHAGQTLTIPRQG